MEAWQMILCVQLASGLQYNFCIMVVVGHQTAQLVVQILNQVYTLTLTQV